MKMLYNNLVVSVIPIQRDGVVKYKNVETGDVYDWSQLSTAPHVTMLGVVDSVSAVGVNVKIGVTATVRGG